MNFELSDIQRLIDQCLKEEPTGDDFIDKRYQEQVGIIGHTNPYYKLFFLIAQELRPKLVVELGSWQGTGAAHFAAGDMNCNVITVDIHKDDKEAQRRTIEAAVHYDNLTYVNQWTWDAVSAVKERVSFFGPIDVLFIDAWHRYDYAMREWELYSPLLNSPALVICDDITEAFNFEKMLSFWDELPGEKFLNDQIHYPIPMGFLKYVGPDREVDRDIQTAIAKRPRQARSKQG